MKKKILLIISPREKLLNKFTYLAFGPSIVASSFDKSKYEVDLYNYDGTDIFPDTDKYDYVLFSSYIWGSQSIDRHIKITDKIYESLKDSLSKIDNKKTIVGGNLVRHYKNKIDADLLVEGGVEKDINDLVDKTGYVVPEHKNVFCMPIDYNILNIKDFQIPHKKILEDIDIVPDDDYVSLIFSRYSIGCDRKCSFCNSRHKGIYFTDIQRAKDSISSYVDNGFNAIAFVDTYANSDKKFVEELCNWIIKRNINISWSHSVRLDANDPDFYKMLYDAGCRQLFSGIESLSTKMLKEIRKGIKRETMLRNLEMIDNAGIFNSCNIILGLPNETRDDLKESIDVIVENKDVIDSVIMNKFIMYSQTDYHRNPKKYDLVVATVNKVEMIYYEKRNRIKYSDTMKKKNEYFDYAVKILKENEMNYILEDQHLIFTLYKQLKSKRKVINILKNNKIHDRFIFEQ